MSFNMEDEFENHVTEAPALEVLVRAKNHRFMDERRDRGLSQLQAADFIGVSAQALGGYERLRKIPNPKHAQKIADFYDKPIEYLFPEVIQLATDCGMGEVKSYLFDQRQIEGMHTENLKYLMESPEKMVNERELKEQIERSLDTLTPREASVINMYYGLDGEEKISLEEIADKFSLTRERVRQIKEKAIRRLRYAPRSRNLREFL